VHYNEDENPYPTDMTKKELAEKYADINIVPLLNDFDKVVEIVEKQIKSTRDGNNIAIDSVKQYFLAIVRLIQRGSPLSLSKELSGKYNAKVIEFDALSNKQRNKNEPKKANLEYPDFTWSVVQKEYEDYVTSHAFTNTAKGRKDLRNACVVGLYVLQRPRRVTDYSSLQWFSKKPTDKEADGHNILYLDDGKFYVSIDKFKTRFRVSCASKQAKELLPRYIKEVNSKLTDLFKKYIKIWNIKDMSKLTNDERRQGKEYYIFHQETKTHEDMYDENSFSKVISNCFKAVFNGRNGLTVNTLRHAFNTWVSEHINEFTDAQLMDIAVDVGDTARSLPTNLRYRIANQENADLNKTEIEGQIHDDAYARNVMMAGAEENASVGNVREQQSPDDDNEVASPAPVNVNNDNNLDDLYVQLGKAVMEVKQLELLISRRLNMVV
jgi:transcription termination factor NusB